ncbi:hypothetical protein Rsub_08578 [Raphidocelis subcapitata]|uniref:Protein kinase domain-containing protein n=1 Tax=Raphidocelis subcapitata TaxID=307507 RepID=A0A2V0PEJ5_9CHLO|nr:hypothetical protein Rsub_08578 [Raphidocelis subcapitata]|eukprot:GBF95597.1 hypothetical protein Rsub_08578 [Raphidocelis subcapitata]
MDGNEWRADGAGQQRVPFDFRSRSLPRLPSTAAAGLPRDGSAARAEPAPASPPPAAPLPPRAPPGGPAQQAAPRSPFFSAAQAVQAAVQVDERFERGARLVADVRAAVRELAADANRARTYRQQCSSVLGAALAASLALQEALASPPRASSGGGGGTAAAGHPAALHHAGAEVAASIACARGLVRKYGRQAPIQALMRRASQEDVADKFADLVAQLNAVEDALWRQIDPDNKLRRELRPPPPPRSGSPRHAPPLGGQQQQQTPYGSPPSRAASLAQGPGSVASGAAGGAGPRGSHRLARRTLRKASKHASGGLVWFADAAGGGGDGAVAWATQHNIKVLSSSVVTVISGAGERLSALCHSDEGLIWSGHDDGSLRAWSLSSADAAAPPLHVADGAITALATDPASGRAWAGTAEGELVVVRHAPGSAPRAGAASPGPGPAFGRLELVQTLGLGLDEALARGSGSRAAGGVGRSSGGGGGGGGGLLTACFSAGAAAPQGSSRFRDAAAHGGAVRAVAFVGGRAYTAGGGSLLVWEAASGELLRTLSKRTSQWLRSPVTALAPVVWSRLGVTAAPGAPSAEAAAAAAAPGEAHLFTGHASGLAVLWDVSEPSPRPVLSLGRERGALVGLGVVEEMALLAAGHDNGRVVLRRLDPKTRLPPRGDAHVAMWQPRPILLPAHRLGLTGLAAGGHVLATTGKSGSVKLAPEACLRILAADAGVRLPQSASAVAEALTALLLGGGGPAQSAAAAAAAAAMLKSAGSSASSASAIGGLLSQYGGSVHAAASGGPLQQALATLDDQVRAQAAGGGDSSGAGAPRASGERQPSPLGVGGVGAGSRGASSGDGGSGGAASAGTSAAATPGRGSGDGAAPAAAAAAAEPADGPPSRGRSIVRQISSSWPSQVQLGLESPWLLPFEELRLGRIVGEGSYGRVYIGAWREAEVAVKQLNAPGTAGAAGSAEGDGAGFVGSGGEGDACWDERLLRALSKEVDILVNLRHPNVVLFLGVCLRPPCVVTEFCALGSLYDVLRKARREPAFAARLTWPRRLLMALDAGKGMLYLHSHRPTILHRDLKSPNLLVAKDWRVQVGDFNLSRYMSRDSAFIKSSLENNPRWCAPEVIAEGRYSKAADVFSFGVVLWELLTWREPWALEGLNSWQIMSALREGQRPLVPPNEELPGALGAPAEVAEYVAVMEACWSSDPAARPGFDEVISRLKGILLRGRASAAGGGGVGARVASASQLRAPPEAEEAPAPPAAASPAAPPLLSPPQAPGDAAATEAAAAAVAAGAAAARASAAAASAAHHRRSVSETAALAPLAGPGSTDVAIANLLNLEEDSVGTEGPSGGLRQLLGGFDSSGQAIDLLAAPARSGGSGSGGGGPQVSPFALAIAAATEAQSGGGGAGSGGGGGGGVGGVDSGNGVADGALALTPPGGSFASSRVTSFGGSAAGGTAAAAAAAVAATPASPAAVAPAAAPAAAAAPRWTSPFAAVEEQKPWDPAAQQPKPAAPAAAPGPAAPPSPALGSFFDLAD